MARLFQFLAFHPSDQLATLDAAQGFSCKGTGEQTAVLIQKVMECPGKLGRLHVKVSYLSFACGVGGGGRGAQEKKSIAFYN